MVRATTSLTSLHADTEVLFKHKKQCSSSHTTVVLSLVSGCTGRAPWKTVDWGWGSPYAITRMVGQGEALK